MQQYHAGPALFSTAKVTVTAPASWLPVGTCTHSCCAAGLGLGVGGQPARWVLPTPSSWWAVLMPATAQSRQGPECGALSPDLHQVRSVMPCLIAASTAAAGPAQRRPG